MRLSYIKDSGEGTAFRLNSPVHVGGRVTRGQGEELGRLGGCGRGGCRDPGQVGHGFGGHVKVFIPVEEGFPPTVRGRKARYIGMMMQVNARGRR